tara:strand:- start:8755 stop:9843 length:1089 start_codon:yes stop_codon:yes gene_type:complete
MRTEPKPTSPCGPNRILILGSWFALTALCACATEPGDVAKSDAGKVAPDSDVEAPDVDPYFHESTSIRTDHGPRTITRNVLEDSQGRVWLATWSGLMRVDGTAFLNVTNQSNLRRHRAFSLMEDRDQNVWVGTIDAGVYRYDGTTFTNLTTKDGLVNDTTLSMFQDRDGDLWFGGLGATSFDGSTFTTYDENDGFTNSDVNSISQAPDGDLWFGTRGRLFRFDGMTFVDFTKEQGLEIESYIPALIDRRGHLWFGGSEGLYRYDGEIVHHVFEPTCFSLFEDSLGRIWFSGGSLLGQDLKPDTTVLNRIDPSNGMDHIMETRHQIELRVGALFGLTEARDGSIWFGAGGGVGRIVGDTVLYF